MIIRITRILTLILAVLSISACSSAQKPKIPLEEYRPKNIEKRVYHEVAEVIFKDGEVRQLVMDLASGNYLHIIADKSIDTKDVDKIRFYDNDGNLVEEFSSSTLGNVIIVFKIVEKGVEKIVGIFR